MDVLLNGFASEIVIIALETVLWLPFIILDYIIIKKIAALSISDKEMLKFNRIKFPIATASMFVCGLILWSILQFGLNIAVLEIDIYIFLLVVSALCAFGAALPVCDFIQYKLLINKIKAKINGDKDTNKNQ